MKNSFRMPYVFRWMTKRIKAMLWLLRVLRVRLRMQMQDPKTQLNITDLRLWERATGPDLEDCPTIKL